MLYIAHFKTCSQDICAENVIQEQCVKCPRFAPCAPSRVRQSLSTFGSSTWIWGKPPPDLPMNSKSNMELTISGTMGLE